MLAAYPGAEGGFAIRGRDIFFTGNLDPGEDIVVEIRQEKPLGGGVIGRHVTIVSEPGQVLLARLFTLRQEGPSGNFGTTPGRDAATSNR